MFGVAPAWVFMLLNGLVFMGAMALLVWVDRMAR